MKRISGKRARAHTKPVRSLVALAFSASATALTQAQARAGRDHIGRRPWWHRPRQRAEEAPRLLPPDVEHGLQPCLVALDLREALHPSCGQPHLALHHSLLLALQLNTIGANRQRRALCPGGYEASRASAPCWHTAHVRPALAAVDLAERFPAHDHAGSVLLTCPTHLPGAGETTWRRTYSLRELQRRRSRFVALHLDLALALTCSSEIERQL